MSVSMQIAPFSGLFVEFWNANAIYDPAILGELMTIDAQFNLQWNQPGGQTPLRDAIAAVLIRQGGELFWANDFRAASGAGWQVSPNYPEVAFTNVDRGSPQRVPDFSAQGLPLEFGLMVMSSHTDVGTAPRWSAFTNWSVTTCSAP